MSKKLVLTIGVLSLLSVVVVILVSLAGPDMLRRVRAFFPESSFTSPFNVSNSPAPDFANTQHPRAIRAPDNLLHVVWMEGTDGYYSAAYTKGQESMWDTWEWVYGGANPAYANPDIARDSQGTLHVVWTSQPSKPYDIYYAYKPVGGTWSAPENLTEILGASQSSFYPAIDVDSQDRIWTAWQTGVSDTASDLWSRSKPAGGAWEAPVKISTSDKQNLNVDIYIGPDDVPHVVWRNNDPGTYDVYYSKFSGGAWGFPLNVSATGPPSYSPRLAGDSLGNLFVVWWEDVGGGGFDIRFRRWDGSQWLPWSQVSNGPKALNPGIAADGCNLYVVWQDYRDDPAYPETYFSHSTDCGTTWLGDENVSQSGSQSYFPDVVAQPGGFAHIFWQDLSPGQLDIFYSKATIEGAVTPIPTTPPIPTPAVPYGSVNVVALDPPGNQEYTRQAAVRLELQATSPAGHDLLMRYDNYADFSGNPTYVTFTTVVPSWNLATAPNSCTSKTVYAQFKDALDGTESLVYDDAIFYDDWLTATLTLNGGNAYTNRTMVKVDSENRDYSVGCSGLFAMQFRESTITYTSWYSYLPGLWYFLQPSGGDTRTVYGHYLDGAGNEGTLSSRITFDLEPPYSGAPPTMPTSTNQLLITVSDLQALDDASGVGYVWLANNCTPQGEGSWLAFPYCSTPPCDYTWNLGYGGPPLEGENTVCVKYEDKSGYGSFQGNFSAISEGTIIVGDTYAAFLPLITRRALLGQGYMAPVEPAGEELFLFADPPQAGLGQEVLLYLVLPGRVAEASEGTLRMQLPRGLQVVRAWSAYGELSYVSDREVRSLERAAPGQVTWLTVLARVVPGADPYLQVQGELIGADGTRTAAPLWVQTLGQQQSQAVGP